MDRLYLLMMGGAPILSALLGTTVFTLLVCRLTMGRFRPLRLLLLVLLAIPLTIALHLYLTIHKPWSFWELGSGVVGGAILVGWLTGWRLSRRKEDI
ncbi:hypothetical protein B5G34_09565 [Flavonifractor sp. An82]|uniref:hypothetical protein n=1 Tax=Flavonifractor sp. An82 TaxID=1965660 RepID=UPI000B3A7354|nr:hypothetical protein [Flavonifractor sp. An82]OUN21908.1 hypothetical protein B5G34_09565 [Flavonifractor sp. An82]